MAGNRKHDREEETREREIDRRTEVLLEVGLNTVEASAVCRGRPSKRGVKVDENDKATGRRLRNGYRRASGEALLDSTGAIGVQPCRSMRISDGDVKWFTWTPFTADECAIRYVVTWRWKTALFWSAANS
uniref:Transposase n=1 Tax=Steinernema glaseri TaxID=37863 RepID=A0A1I7XXF5_9BILA